jgi:hypothetical protein
MHGIVAKCTPTVRVNTARQAFDHLAPSTSGFDRAGFSASAAATTAEQTAQSTAAHAAGSDGREREERRGSRKRVMMDGIGTYGLVLFGRVHHSAYGEPGEGEGSWDCVFVLVGAIGIIIGDGRAG